MLGGRQSAWIVCACVIGWAGIAHAQDATPIAPDPGGQTPSAQTPSAQTPSAQTPSAQTPSAQTPSAQTPASDPTPPMPRTWDGEGGAAEGPTPLYRELPVPLAESSSQAASAAGSDAPATSPRRARLGPWEVEGRVALSSGGSVGPGVALGYRLAVGWLLMADVTFGFDIADDGKAGPSGVTSSWGWGLGLELKAYLQPARVRRVVPLFRARLGFAYSDTDVEGEDGTATYRVTGAPYMGAAVFLTQRAGLLVELGAELSRVISSSRYAWTGAVVTRLAVVLRW